MAASFRPVSVSHLAVRSTVCIVKKSRFPSDDGSVELFAEFLLISRILISGNKKCGNKRSSRNNGFTRNFRLTVCSGIMSGSFYLFRLYPQVRHGGPLRSVAPSILTFFNNLCDFQGFCVNQKLLLAPVTFLTCKSCCPLIYIAERIFATRTFRLPFKLHVHKL